VRRRLHDGVYYLHSQEKARAPHPLWIDYFTAGTNGGIIVSPRRCTAPVSEPAANYLSGSLSTRLPEAVRDRVTSVESLVT
jgi:hypothetical protein